MLQQPRVPPTGQRQAIEVHIKWREVLDYKRELLRMLSLGTGWDVEKLDYDMQRPLYMRPVVGGVWGGGGEWGDWGKGAWT
jgi:ATP-dependent Clp protease protease subunit